MASPVYRSAHLFASRRTANISHPRLDAFHWHEQHYCQRINQHLFPVHLNRQESEQWKAFCCCFFLSLSLFLSVAFASFRLLKCLPLCASLWRWLKTNLLLRQLSPPPIASFASPWNRRRKIRWSRWLRTLALWMRCKPFGVRCNASAALLKGTPEKRKI